MDEKYLTIPRRRKTKIIMGGRKEKNKLCYR